MKRILLLLLFGLGIFSAQSQITVDNTLTVQQLVDDVLILGECAEVSNVVSPMSSDVAGLGFDSYGAFDSTTAPQAFPFDGGIILATNGIDMIPTGAPNQNGGNPPWLGDTDLDALIQEPNNTNNATTIEFDFIPFVDEISFNYMFASDEYPNFVCSFADTFAFIISGPGISDVNDYNHDANPNTPDVTLDLGGQNIAVIPGTTIPVSPVNIHLNPNCPPGSLGEFAVPQLFDDANADNGSTMYGGQTVPLTATADVIPGQTYNIKLVIADRGDTILNSAVFIESESFDLGGIDLGPDITISNGNAVCEGDTVTLDAGFSAANIQYFWAQDGDIIPNENGQTLEVTESGVYEVGIQVGSGGTACFGVSNQVTVEFFPEPAFDPTDPIDLCAEESVVLDGTPSNASVYTSLSYQWSQDGVELPGETNPTLTVTEGGQYDLVVDANACDDATNSFTVNLIDYQVSLPAVPDPCIGQGEAVTLTPAFTGLTQDEIDNAVTYEWTTADGVFTTPSLDITQGQEVTLTTSFNGCEESVTETFTFFNNPVVSISGPTSICQGDTLTLDGTPANLSDLTGANYTWFLDSTELTGETGATLDITNGGVYEVVVDNNGCETQSAEFEVELIDYQVSLPAVPDPCIGQGEAVTLTPAFTGLTQDEIDNAVTYEWTTADGVFTTPSLDITQGQEVTLTTSFNGCEESVTETFSFFNNPMVDIAGASVICQGDTNTLDATPMNLNDLLEPTYSWTKDGVEVSSAAEPTLDITEGGVYEVTVDNNGCTSTAQIEVELVDFSVDLGEDQNLCTGDGGPENITLTPSITNLSSAQQNQTLFTWSDGSTEETLTVSNSGTYSVEVDVNGCIQTASISVSIVETVDIILEDIVKCPEDEVVLEPGLSITNPDLVYSWTLDGQPIGDNSPTVDATQEGDYVLTVNNQGCISTATASVSGYNVDNCVITQGISPNVNADGKNDCMDLAWLNDQLGIERFQVFNRYGRKVFDETNYVDSFCGQDENGDELSTGTYFYVLNLENSDERYDRVIKGWVYVNAEQ